MIGLPTETMEDIEGIAELGNKVLDKYYQTPRELRGKSANISISISSFVPKPFTPFQWESQNTIELLRQKQRYLQKLIKRKGIKLSWHNPNTSFLEAVLARGDRKLSKVLIKAWELGCRFDSWEQQFKYRIWEDAFNQCDIDPEFYALRKRDTNEILPWDLIDIGVTKEFLNNEYKKAYKEETTNTIK